MPINILFKKEKLNTLPTDKPIVIMCHSVLEHLHPIGGFKELSLGEHIVHAKANAAPK